jgi:hypothetical protein
VWFVASAFAGAVEMPEEDALTSLRLRSMGGAVSGMAESASANLDNPAAVGIRKPTAPQRRIDFDLAFQVRDHPILSLVFPHPPAPYRSAYVQVIPNFRVGRVGFTAGWRETRVRTEQEDLGTFLASPGVAVAGGAFSIGVLTQILGIQADGRGQAYGFGGTLGALYAPAGQFRAGASLRTPIRTGTLRGGGNDQARLPLEAQVGATWSFDLDNAACEWGPCRERGEAEVAALFTAELVVTGSSDDAVILSEGDDQLRSSPTSLSPRGGTELWVAQDRGRIRFGAGWLPGRGGSPDGPYTAMSLGWRLFDDPRGFSWRAVVGFEQYSPGRSIGVGLETW